MNSDWSKYVQGINTLYCSRSLRFSDMFREKYLNAFGIENKGRFLETGCGPGALAEALHRWYPAAEITGVDRDEAFIEFAKRKAPEIRFRVEDATALSFPDDSFDVTISNTVAEHIEPSKFYGEQYRVLKKEGVCLVLSSRRGIKINAPCVEELSDFELEIWERASLRREEYNKKTGVCLYPMNEREIPLCMEKYGFHHVSTEYITVNLTPDEPFYSRETAQAMINSDRECDLEGADTLREIATDLVSEKETAELKRLINQRYDKRLQLYDSGIKQWDTDILMIMIVKGVK